MTFAELELVAIQVWLGRLTAADSQAGGDGAMMPIIFAAGAWRPASPDFPLTVYEGAPLSAVVLHVCNVVSGEKRGLVAYVPGHPAPADLEQARTRLWLRAEELNGGPLKRGT